MAVRFRSPLRMTGLRFCLPASRPLDSSTPCLIDISTPFTFFASHFLLDKLWDL